MGPKTIAFFMFLSLAACNASGGDQDVAKPEKKMETPKIIKSGPCNGVKMIERSGPFTAALMDDGAHGFLVDATPEMIECAQANNLAVNFTHPVLE